MKLYFARHGESEANILREISNRGYRHGLTEKGRQQAQALARSLAGNGIQYIYSSPLQRAVETSQILSAGLGIAYEITAALREYDCGIAEGRADQAAWDLWRWVREEWFVQGRPDSRIEGGEILIDIRARFVPLVQSLLTGLQQDVLLVGHGGLFNCTLPVLLRNIDLAFFETRGLPNTGYVLAERRGEGLVCVSWCGEKIGV